AEELTGVTFERALRLWHRFDPDRGSVRTWLCQVARTVAIDQFRSERRRTRREELAAPPEAVDVRFGEGLSPELESALARLTAGAGAGDRRRRLTRRRALGIAVSLAATLAAAVVITRPSHHQTAVDEGVAQQGTALRSAATPETHGAAKSLAVPNTPGRVQV